MRNLPISRRIALAGTITALAGCVSMSPRYQNPSSGAERSVTSRPDYTLAFVEFGEQGSYLDTSQIEAAVRQVRYAQRPLVITYVHGWHNDSGSADVARFSDFLSKVAATPLIKSHQFRVIGVYLAWRGDITKIPILTELTFYSRKTAAERLASNFDCFDAISSIAEAARGHHIRSAQYTILMGHSFGGLVVERAVAHALDEKMHGRNAKGAQMPADVTVVWNPASDSILSRQMIAALDQWRTDNTRPLFISVTSKADAATRLLFNYAMTLAATTKAFPQVADPGTQHLESERRFFVHTPGQNSVLLNHEAVPAPFSLKSSAGDAVDMNLSHNLKGDVVALPADSGGIELWTLQHIPTSVDVPYWNIQVDSQIIKNHGDIWNAKSQALLAGLFRIANPLEPAHGRPEAQFTRRDFQRSGHKQPGVAPTPAAKP